MKLKLRVDGSTTASELRLLGVLFTGLAEQYAPVDEAELVEPEPPSIPLNREEPVVHVPTPTTTEVVTTQEGGKVKRTRRTKDKIEAAAAELAKLAEENSKVADADAAVQDSNEASLAEIEVAQEPAPLAETPAPTPAVQQPDTPPSETASTVPASESPSETKTYTPAEVQKIAVATAGRFGPEKVKAIIAQYPGAARIADIPVGELAGFVAKLNAVS